MSHLVKLTIKAFLICKIFKCKWFKLNNNMNLSCKPEVYETNHQITIQIEMSFYQNSVVQITLNASQGNWICFRQKNKIIDLLINF